MTSRRPNILITGTPGTGKTQLAMAVAEAASYRHIEVGKLVTEKGFHKGWNDEWQTYELDEADEDALLDELEELQGSGSLVVDYHSSELFPERWFQLVIVLRAEPVHIKERLSKRGYNDKKISENIECEIMQVCLCEAMDSYNESIVKELQSNSIDQFEGNVGTIAAWIRNNV